MGWETTLSVRVEGEAARGLVIRFVPTIPHRPWHGAGAPDQPSTSHPSSQGMGRGCQCDGGRGWVRPHPREGREGHVVGPAVVILLTHFGRAPHFTESQGTARHCYQPRGIREWLKPRGAQGCKDRGEATGRS